MHEMGIAQNIVEIVVEAAEGHGATRITRVQLRAGALRAIIGSQLEFCFSFMAKDTIAEGAELKVEVIPAEAACRCCGTRFGVETPGGGCPDCLKKDFELVSGTELFVSDIEAE